MILTLNYEAPGKNTVELTDLLHCLFASPVTRTRVQESSYQGPEGQVHARTVISKVTTPLNRDAVVEAAFALACQLDEDCVAVRFETAPSLAAGRPANVLVGPRADKWLPFNPEFFVEY